MSDMTEANFARHAALFGAHPRITGLEQIPVPYRTLCFRATLAATGV